MGKQPEDTLREKGVTPTTMRLLVLEYFLQQSAAASLPKLEEDFYHADRTTLYRTLKTFEEKGIIHRIADDTGATKYALCADACKDGEHYDLHLHFHCSHCAQTFCLPRTKIPEISLPDDFRVEELSLVAKGICNRCRTKQRN